MRAATISSDELAARPARTSPERGGEALAISSRRLSNAQVVAPRLRRNAIWLVEHRWQPGAGGLVVEPQAHQRQALGGAQTFGQAPAHQLAVAGRDEHARTAEGFGRPEQRLEVVVGLADRVAEEGDGAGVARDAARALHHPRRALVDGRGELAAARGAVDAGA